MQALFQQSQPTPQQSKGKILALFLSIYVYANHSVKVIAFPENKNGATLSELRKKFISAGAKDAINLDGGGSTQFYAPAGNHFSGRRVRGFIGIWVRGGNRRRVSVRTSLNVRSGPGLWYSRVGRFYNGDVVTVTEEQGLWSKTPAGWVYSSYLEKI